MTAILSTDTIVIYNIYSETFGCCSCWIINESNNSLFKPKMIKDYQNSMQSNLISEVGR